MDIDTLEELLGVVERELKTMNDHHEVITRNYNELVEMRHVLEKDADFFDQTAISETVESLEDTTVPLLEGTKRHYLTLGFTTGVIMKDMAFPFERVLWRALRGNLVVRTAELDEPIIDPVSGETVEKTVFVVFHQGTQADAKVKRICDSFGARIYACPDSAKQRRDLWQEVSNRIKDLSSVLDRANMHRRKRLAFVDTQIEQWATQVRREKEVFHAMNMFNYDSGRKCLLAQGWSPVSAQDGILRALERATTRSGVQVPSIMAVVRTKQEPPTYFPTDKFTECTQGIIEAYGTARYGEVNPAVLSIVTFPFLFAVMFGDAGHAVMMLAAALAFIYYEKALAKISLNEIVEMLFFGRYVLLLMALFSIFTGILYNDVFGLGMDLFGTAWRYNEQKREWVKTSRTYEFGVDPIWKGAENELYYYNSLKMKLSVVIGVIQMTVGIVHSLFNHLHFRKPLNIIFEFIPQMIFMCGLFGYLITLIFIKWIFVLPNEPYLVNVLIDMFLKWGALPPEECIYPGQNTFQSVTSIAAIVAVLVMLFPKPLILLFQHNRAVAARAALAKSEVALEGGHAAGAEEDNEPEFEFMELFIHQCIHTIEFVLGCISNTASYLRLWALSLAHAELSLVFYEQVFLTTVRSGNILLIFVGFAVWGGATICVLLIMEALSAFLHALRLHWVEFQNKFYEGDGYAFSPFAYLKMTSVLIEERLVAGQQ
eukprot:TRINITY_DN1421_c0_g2_i1.p1 TRINITY_DN1421_c0_g2~~TRINITY_DN1421_c0_g2_i1.p1  ORF type:complete len:834 (+),score=240.26 TRINITY_DN1421_c0_g2_i1:368-2503(+)